MNITVLVLPSALPQYAFNYRVSLGVGAPTCPALQLQSKLDDVLQSQSSVHSPDRGSREEKAKSNGSKDPEIETPPHPIFDDSALSL